MDTGIRHNLKRSHAEDSALPCQALKVHMRAGFRSFVLVFDAYRRNSPRQLDILQDLHDSTTVHSL